MNVLICDDQADRCNDVEESIKAITPKGVNVKTLVAGALEQALKGLFDTVNAVLDGGPKGPDSGASEFSNADLVILDNNLAHLEIKGARLTAESIAGYLRVVSPAYVVSVNKNPEVDFDLRFLVGDYATRADLAINTEHLGNLALWTGNPGDAKNGFLPWYWPALLHAPARRSRQIAFLEGRLDEKAISAIQMPAAAADSLSRHARGVLAPQALSDGTGAAVGTALADITLRDFLKASSRTLPLLEERERLVAAADKRPAAAVLAADLELWFRRDVTGPQETLVDVPHLLSRMPFLLGERVRDPANWRSAATASTSPFGLDETLYRQFLGPQLFPAWEMWTGRPAFWWPVLRDNAELNKRFGDGEAGWPDVVFCEDGAEFVSRNAGGDGPREFVAEFDSPWDRRYVKQLRGVKYSPRSRLAL